MPLLYALGIFFLAVVMHEYAHGWVAYRLGDPTAKLADRLTLNPLAHIDPIGTIVLPIALAVLQAPVIFGWAKPVPVNALALRNPRRDIVWVGLAGPFANLLCATGLSLLIRRLDLPPDSPVATALTTGLVINVVLACFNLIPIPPLDGSRVLLGVLPRRLAISYARLEPYGFLIVLLLLYLGVMKGVVWPMVLWFLERLGVP